MTTKEKILKAALELFAKQGIENTSTAEITQKVGVATGTLFVHFKTKQELIDTLYVEIKKQAFSKLTEHIANKRSVEKNVKVMTKKVIEYFVKNYDEFKFMELVDASPVISDAALEAGKNEYRELTNYVAEWIKKGFLKKLDDNLIIATVWGLCSVIINYCVMNNKDKVAKDQLELVWGAIRK